MATASKLRNEHGKSSSLLHGMVETVQLNPTDILYAKIVIDEFAAELSLVETRLGSSKAQTTTKLENGLCIGPAASLEEMMMQLESFGKWKKKNYQDLIWRITSSSRNMPVGKNTTPSPGEPLIQSPRILA